MGLLQGARPSPTAARVPEEARPPSFGPRRRRFRRRARERPPRRSPSMPDGWQEARSRATTEVYEFPKKEETMFHRRSTAVNRSKESPPYRHYYEHDGALRAYANRAMLLALLTTPTALVAVCMAAYVRLQPPTLIRVDAAGSSEVLKA